MLLSGFAMLIVAALSFNAEKGNVVPSLIIAFLGVITNSWFWFRYRKLDREQPDTILSVQSKLYLAKSVVDISVAIALAFVALTPTSPFVGYVDLTGAVVVAAYLMITGINTIRGRQLLQAPV